MSLTAAQIVTLRAPASYAADPNLDDLISLAESNLSSEAFGDFHSQAVALLVCHWIAKKERGSAGGSVSMEKEGELARSYAVTADGDDWSSTSYGQELKRLQDSVMFKPMNRMMGT